MSVRTLVLATKNNHKVKEFTQAFAPYQIIVKPIAEHIIMPQETGLTFLENALLKAHSIAKQVGVPVLADDSGLCVDVLEGAPGIYSARYAGEPSDDRRNREKLLEALRGIDSDQRKAHFTCSLALVWPDGREIGVTGMCQGLIVEENLGSEGFGYDPLFYYPPFQKTFAEISLEEKNQISHRARAVEMLIPSLTLLE
nr:XTP/dITP diphosphatase [Bacilli bacterium]